MKHIVKIAETNYVLYRSTADSESESRLQIEHHGDIVFDICLDPVLNGKKFVLGTWKKNGHNSYKASLGKDGNSSANICEIEEKLAFWIQTAEKQLDSVTYLSDGLISGDSWRTFVSDDYERLWDKKIDTNIPISSSYAASNSPDGTTGGGMTDPDDIPVHWIWNVHPRVCAVKGMRSWLGISIPGAWGIGITRLNMHKTRFNLRFEMLQTGCTDGKMPVVYFSPGLADGFDVLDEYRNISEKLGLFNLENKEYPKWWTNPWFGYYDEMQRQLHSGLINQNSANVIELLDGWVEKTKELCGIKNININLEQGCYRLYGDYRPAEIFGTEQHVRNTVDSWREKGIHVGHYIHPFVVNTKIPFYAEHPEAFCKPKDPGFLMDYPLETWDPEDPKFAPIDWTHPLGREYMLGWVEYLISSKPGCMNFDILRSNNWRSPDPRYYDFHDPDWGVGDMMTYKVQKLMYDKAKEVKPDCLVSKLTALDCCMQPTYDAMQLAEDWTHNMQYWYRRVHVATRLLKNTFFWIDPWFLTRTKWNEYYMCMMVLGTPETQSVEHAPHCYYPRWMPLEQKHYGRRKSGIHVFLNSPAEPADECRLTWDFENLEVYRLKTTGPLAGWFGAKALSPRCFVTYSETQALIGSSENRLDYVPLPPNAELKKVTRVLHNGREEEVEYVYDDKQHRVQLYIEDCGGDVFYYCIQYRLAVEER